MLTYKSFEPETLIKNESYTSVVMPQEQSRHNAIKCLYINSKRKLQSSFSSVYAYSIERERQDLENFILNLKGLEEDWDGYGGLPIYQEVVDHGLNLLNVIKLFPDLPNPIITPKSNGTISVTWETSNGVGYIEIGRTRFSGYLQIGDSKPAYFQGLAHSIEYEPIAFIYFNLFQSNMISAPITNITI